jgi:hypothetical protein
MLGGEIRRFQPYLPSPSLTLPPLSHPSSSDGAVVMASNSIVGKGADHHGVLPVHAFLVVNVIIGAICAYFSMVQAEPDFEYR